MMLITKVLKKTTGEDNKKTEMYALFFANLRSFFITNSVNRFMTANRTVRTGLTASAVISVSPSPPAAWITTDKGPSSLGFGQLLYSAHLLSATTMA